MCIIWALSEIRTLISPTTVKVILQGTFDNIPGLKSVILSEGLEYLGIDYYTPEGTMYRGVFCGCGLRKIRLPSTLKAIEYNTFEKCKHLKNITLPKKLVYIGKNAFRESGLERVVFPSSLRAVGAMAFADCERLRNVQLN